MLYDASDSCVKFSCLKCYLNIFVYWQSHVTVFQGGYNVGEKIENFKELLRTFNYIYQTYSCDVLPRQSVCRATSSCDKVAVCKCACRILQLCRINKNDQSALTAFSKQSCTEQSTALFQKGVARLLQSSWHTMSHLRFCCATKLRNKIGLRCKPRFPVCWHTGNTDIQVSQQGKAHS